MKGKIFILAFFVLNSCKYSSNQEAILENSLNDKIALQVSWSSYKIPIDSATTHYYQKHSLIELNSNYYLYGYNNVTHSLDIINISNRSVEGHINLQMNGPDQILRVYGLQVIGPDSIYILDHLHLKLLNRKGIVLKTFNLSFDEIDIPNIGNGYFIQFNEANFNISEDGRYFQGYFINRDILGNRTKKKLQGPIIGKIDLLTNAVKFHPVQYSEFIINNKGDFGNEITPNISYYHDKIIFGFPVESNIYVYNYDNDTVMSYGSTSKYSENASRRYNTNLNYDFRTHGTWFNSVNSLLSENLYFRTHWGSQPIKANISKDGLEKPGYIMVFDSVFNVIDELGIPDQLWIEDNITLPESIYFWPKIGRDYPPDTLVLGKCDIIRIVNQ